MSLSVRAERTTGGFSLDIDLDVDDLQTVAVLGPNGAGKSTLVAIVAGVFPVDRGRVVIDDTVVDDPDAHTWIPPELRRTGVVFQGDRLFPHLSARDNVAFGPRCRGASRRSARATATAWLDRLGLAAKAEARPPTLSGGQARLVALARALATAPRVLLLDEPLRALDVDAARHVRSVLVEHLADFEGTRMLITHDPDDVVLADRVVRLDHGRVVSDGPS